MEAMVEFLLRLRSVIVASVVIPHLEETVHQIARLVAAVVRGIPFYNVEGLNIKSPRDGLKLK